MRNRLVLGGNIFLRISQKLSPKMFIDFQRFSDILLRFSRLFTEYLCVCNFIHTFSENTIRFLKNMGFFISCKFRELPKKSELIIKMCSFFYFILLQNFSEKMRFYRSSLYRQQEAYGKTVTRKRDANTLNS